MTTTLLSAVINNVAAVILMAAAMFGSSASLAPIGHQSNTIVTGPGGNHFAHYFKMGLRL